MNFKLVAKYIWRWHFPLFFISSALLLLGLYGLMTAEAAPADEPIKSWASEMDPVLSVAAIVWGFLGLVRVALATARIFRVAADRKG